MFEALSRILSELLLPPFGLFALLLLAFALRSRLRRTANALALVSVLLMWTCSCIGVNEWLQPIPTQVSAFSAPPYPPADAIVVLGGDRYLHAPEYGEDTAGPSTLERVRYAAKLARETGKPILASGGRPLDLGLISEAEIMRDILQDEWHQPVRWIEPQSRTTAENAVNSAVILRNNDIQRIYLVTHHHHMTRAMAAFEAAGIDVVPMPTSFPQPESSSPMAWLPTFRGLARNRAWAYEQLAQRAPF